MPTWLNDSTITIIRTHNGYALAPAANSQAAQCLAFETWDALIAFLSAHFGK